MDLKAALLKGADALDAQTRFDHDRSKYMNASEANRCIRRQWYEKHGGERDGGEENWGFARRGTHGELYIVSALKEAGVEIIYTGGNQLSLQDEERKLSGTPDGIILPAGERDQLVVPEFKTFDPRSNTSRFPKPDHVEQNKICQHLVDQWELGAQGARDFNVSGVLLYMNASDFSDIHVFPVDAPTDRDLSRWKRRASKILRSRNPQNLDREGKTTGECRQCPFTKTCGVKGASGGGSKRTNRGSNLHEAAERIASLKAQKSELEQEEKELKETIKDELTRRQLKHTVVGNIEITLSTVAGRTSLDRKAVAAAGIDLSPYEKQGAPSERLEVKQHSAA